MFAALGNSELLGGGREVDFIFFFFGLVFFFDEPNRYEITGFRNFRFAFSMQHGQGEKEAKN